jgi:myosin heavy subunit
MLQEVEKRVDTLEAVLGEFIVHTQRSHIRLEREMKEFKNEMLRYREESKQEMTEFKAEMKEFKDEMKEFKDEMLRYREESKIEMTEFKAEMTEFKDEMKEFKDEMLRYREESKIEMTEFKAEMKDFKDQMLYYREQSQKGMEEFKAEMKEFKEEMRADTKLMKKQWAELSDKLGSFAEDISLPNIPRIANVHFGEPLVLTYMPNVRKRNILIRGDEFEFDGIVETENKVFLMEAKFTVRMPYIDQIPKIQENFRAVFPEYASKELITIFASMSIHENVVKKLTKMGVYAMSLGDDNMDLLNFEELQKKRK